MPIRNTLSFKFLSSSSIRSSKRKRKAPLPPPEGSDQPLSSKKGGTPPASSARRASSVEKRKKVTIRSVISTAPAPVQEDIEYSTTTTTDVAVADSSTSAKRRDAPLFEEETSANSTRPPGTGTSSIAVRKQLKTPSAIITLMAKQSASAAGGNGNGKGKKKKITKEKPELVTPAEFARRLLRKVPVPAVAGPSETVVESRQQASSVSSSVSAGKEAPSQYLKDYVIFYAGGDLTYASARTRGCMSYVCVRLLSLQLFP